MITKGERIVLTYVVDGIDRYIISHNLIKGLYYLYEVKDREYIKTSHKGENPIELEKYMKVGTNNESTDYSR